MNMRSKCYALALCASMLCVGSAWAQQFVCANTQQLGNVIPQEGSSVVQDGVTWKVIQNDEKPTASTYADWIDSGASGNNICTYKLKTDLSGKMELKLQAVE